MNNKSLFKKKQKPDIAHSESFTSLPVKLQMGTVIAYLKSRALGYNSELIFLELSPTELNKTHY